MHFKRYGCVADCFLLAVICVGLVLPLACCERSHGGEKEEAEAAAALALAKAKRERLQGVGKQLEVSTECHTDLVTATRECDRTGKRLVIWVSCEPRKHLEFYRPLIDQVHACIKSHNKSDEPRVVIQGGDGIERYFPERKLTVEKAGDVRAYWKLANDRPANAPPAKVIEEVKVPKGKIPDRRDYKFDSDWLSAMAERGKVPIGEVVCMSAYGKIVQGDGFQYAPDAVDRLGGGATGPNGEKGFAIPAISGEQSLAMLEPGGLLESKDTEWTNYMKAQARGMIAWEKAGRPGMFMGGDVDPVLAWRMNENQKAMRRSWGASRQNDHNEPSEPPKGATEADWQFYRNHVAKLPADRAKQEKREAEERARFAEFQRLRDNGTLGPTPTSPASGPQSKSATYYTQDAAGGWLAWNGSAWAKSQTGPPAGYGIVGYLRSPQQEAAPALTAGANFQYAPPVAACTSNG